VDSTAVVGPLASYSEPHSYDLCEAHALRLTAPKGWDVVRHEGGFDSPEPSGDDLTALAEAVREAARAERVSTVEEQAQEAAGYAAPGRRGHLRALPDPVEE
jgi:hypothetical protein